MKRFPIFIIAALLAAACNDNSDAPQTPRTHLISFESISDFNGNPAVPGHATATGFIDNEYDGVFWGKPYAVDAKINVYGDVMADYKMYHGLLFSDGIARFGSYYDDGMQWGTGVPYDTWDGFVVSQICDTSAEEVNYSNQFSVWASGGANGTKNFAVGYYPDVNYIDTAATPYMIPTIEFATECEVRSLWVANSTVAYPYTPAAGKESLTLLITACLGGVKVGEQQIAMGGRDGKLSDWTKVECAFGSKVDKLVFTMSADDELCPTYFCIDELTVVY